MQLNSTLLSRWLLAVALTLFLPVLSARAQENVTIRLAVNNDGDAGQPSPEWRGDVIAEGYEGWVELKSAGFSLSREISTSGGGGSPAKFSNLGILKMVDCTSPKGFRAVASGSSVTPSANAYVSVHYLTSGPDGRVFLRLKLEGVFFANISSSATAAGEVIESVEMFFTKMTMIYVPETGSEISHSYNQITGVVQ